jgi:hypothetical protein
MVLSNSSWKCVKPSCFSCSSCTRNISSTCQKCNYSENISINVDKEKFYFLNTSLISIWPAWEKVATTTTLNITAKHNRIFKMLLAFAKIWNINNHSGLLPTFLIKWNAHKIRSTTQKYKLGHLEAKKMRSQISPFPLVPSLPYKYDFCKNITI